MKPLSFPVDKAYKALTLAHAALKRLEANFDHVTMPYSKERMTLYRVAMHDLDPNALKEGRPQLPPVPMTIATFTRLNREEHCLDVMFQGHHRLEHMEARVDNLRKEENAPLDRAEAALKRHRRMAAVDAVRERAEETLRANNKASLIRRAQMKAAA